MLDADRLIIPSDDRNVPAPNPAVDELLTGTPSHGAYGSSPRHRPVRQSLDENSPPPIFFEPAPNVTGYRD